MRLRRAPAFLLMALAVSACAHDYSPGVVVGAAIPVYAAATEAPYQLDAGDRLRVVVFGQEGLTNAYAVDPNGAITMPLIGAVPARGLTTTELAASIAARLRRGYIREPHVAVEIEAYRPFFILGEVTNPGQYPYVANMTVETAVAIAGGFTPRAFRREVKVSRTQNGVVTRGSAPLIFQIQPGDTINVGERWF
jgi:polysaccharide export outer membrane protein